MGALSALDLLPFVAAGVAALVALALTSGNLAAPGTLSLPFATAAVGLRVAGAPGAWP